jgi:hypothetical protein
MAKIAEERGHIMHPSLRQAVAQLIHYVQPNVSVSLVSSYLGDTSWFPGHAVTYVEPVEAKFTDFSGTFIVAHSVAPDVMEQLERASDVGMVAVYNDVGTAHAAVKRKRWAHMFMCDQPFTISKLLGKCTPALLMYTGWAQKAREPALLEGYTPVFPAQ